MEEKFYQPPKLVRKFTRNNTTLLVLGKPTISNFCRLFCGFTQSLLASTMFKPGIRPHPLRGESYINYNHALYITLAYLVHN